MPLQSVNCVISLCQNASVVSVSSHTTDTKECREGLEGFVVGPNAAKWKILNSSYLFVTNLSSVSTAPLVKAFDVGDAGKQADDQLVCRLERLPAASSVRERPNSGSAGKLVLSKCARQKLATNASSAGMQYKQRSARTNRTSCYPPFFHKNHSEKRFAPSGFRDVEWNAGYINKTIHDEIFGALMSMILSLKAFAHHGGAGGVKPAGWC